MSHGDADHSAGLTDLAGRFSIHHIDGFAGKPCRPGRREWLNANVEITFLSGSGHSTVEPNADSCAVSLMVFDTRILFPGDIGSEQERDIVAYWDRQQLATDILSRPPRFKNIIVGDLAASSETQLCCLFDG